jgi:hypothetical protein
LFDAETRLDVLVIGQGPFHRFAGKNGFAHEILTDF